MLPELQRSAASTMSSVTKTVAPDKLLRSISPFSTKEKIFRLLWAMIQNTVFRYSFHTCFALRATLLRMFGAHISTSVRIRRTARVECPWNLTVGCNSSVGDHAILYCLGHVTIGRNVTVSQHAHICAGTHDYRYAEMPLIRQDIDISDDAWVATDAFVGPGVRVGQGAILGARGSAFRDLDPWGIFGGTPAKRIGTRCPMHDSVDGTYINTAGLSS